MVIARYHGQVVFCRDVPATADLYEQSLGFHRAYESNGDISLRVSVAGDTGVSVEVYLHPAGQLSPVELGTFIVDDVDDAVGELVGHGWEVATAPVDMPWGVRQAMVRDLNGHTLTINSPAAMNHA